MRIIKKAISLVIMILILFTGVFYINADNKEKLKDVKNQINDIRGQIGQKNQKLSETNKNILQIDSKISELEVKIFENDKKLKLVQSRILENRNKIKEKQKEIENLNIKLKRRVKIMSKVNNLDYLEIILSSKDIKDFLSKYTTIKRIIKQDNENIEKLKFAKKQLNEAEITLEKDENSQKNIVYDLKQQNSILNESKKQQDEAMKKLQNDIESLSQLEYIRIKESNEIEEEIKKAEQKRIEEERKRIEEEQRRLRQQRKTQQSDVNKTPFVNYTAGKMGFPLPGGIITSSYGYRYHPILHRKMLHTGVDIGAGYGTGIQAAKSGVVISAGYKGTYGQAVIIDHGNGISTLYAHCSAVNVSVGQNVKAGDIVAFVGTSGRSTGPHLHFEVRINGQYTDPMPYLR